MKKFLLVSFFFLALFFTTECAEVIAIGDLHGDLENALHTFELAGIISEQDSKDSNLDLLVQDNQIVIQMGDILDRGSNGLVLLHLMMHWHNQTKQSHVFTLENYRIQQFVQLIGNHEVLNLKQKFQYVNIGELSDESYREAFTNEKSEERQHLISNTHAVTVVDGVVYVHAGLLPSMFENHWNSANARIEGINMYLRNALQTHKKHNTFLSQQGPMWTRELANGDCEKLYETLELLNAKHMVVGHTVQKNGRVNIKCFDPKRMMSLVLIDTGISSIYGGNLCAVKILNGRYLTAYYLDQNVTFDLQTNHHVSEIPPQTIPFKSVMYRYLYQQWRNMQTLFTFIEQQISLAWPFLLAILSLVVVNCLTQFCCFENDIENDSKKQKFIF